MEGTCRLTVVVALKNRPLVKNKKDDTDSQPLLSKGDVCNGIAQATKTNHSLRLSLPSPFLQAMLLTYW